MADERTNDADWPDFDVPVEALNEGAPRNESPVAPVSTPPAAATPPAPAVPPAAVPPVVPPAAATGTTSTTDSERGETVPIYRLNEVTERARAAQAENKRLTDELARLRAAPPQAAPLPAAVVPPPAAEPPDEATQAIQARLEQIYPELKQLKTLAKFAEKSGDIEATQEVIRRYQEAETRYFDQHTRTQVSNLFDRAASELMGEGKTQADLPEMTKDSLLQSFAKWVQTDPERTGRYEALDPKLEGEFWTVYRAAVFDPVRRMKSVAAITSSESRPGLPTGGTHPGPAASTPPKPAASDDEDAVHEKAWQQFQTSRG